MGQANEAKRCLEVVEQRFIIYIIIYIINIHSRSHIKKLITWIDKCIIHRAISSAANFQEALEENKSEKAARVKTQKQLKAAQSQLKKFKEKDESVQELRRRVNELSSIKGAHDRVEERYNACCMCL